MAQLFVSGRLEEVNKESLNTCIINSYVKGQIFEETELCLKCGSLIYFHSKLLKASGILIREIKITNSTGITEGLEISGESIIMRFLIQVEKDKPTHNITYGFNSETRYVKTYKTTESIFMIILSKDFYFHLIHHTYESHKEFAAHIFRKATTDLFITDLPIDPMIGGIIYEIKNCKRTGIFKRIFIENKVQELLLLQLELYLNHRKYKNRIGLNDVDIAKLNKAKLILDNNYTKALSLQELSKNVSLNETKLRKGFKNYFDVTIKTYVTSLKMKYALELLQEKKYNITEIAYLCGYNGLVQFSRAFKNIYGCSPKKYQI